MLIIVLSVPEGGAINFFMTATRPPLVTDQIDEELHGQWSLFDWMNSIAYN